MSKKYFVTMTDSFMSGWGLADNKINKLVFECESMQEAKTVEQNALNRDEMKFVNIRSTKPYYTKDYHYTQFKDKNDYPAWYIPNNF